MVSRAEEWQAALEARGEYVVKANVGYFAVIPSTWQQRVEAAKRDGRDGPSLVVFRSRSGNPRDHHVIPYSTIRALLVPETLTVSRKDGSKRWNLTLLDELLFVRHSSQRIPVREYRGASLLVEGQPSRRRGAASLPWDWKARVAQWAARRRLDERHADAIIAYFELAFDNTQCADRAWFGTQRSTVSLVVGGIFLAAISHHSATDRGIWLLLDEDALEIEGIDYRPVKSTRASPHKLRWGHSYSFDVLQEIVASQSLWRSFARVDAQVG